MILFVVNLVPEARARLLEGGFKPFDLASEFGDAQWMDDAYQRLGRGFRVRLAGPKLDPLVNHFVEGVRWPEELLDARAIAPSCLLAFGALPFEVPEAVPSKVLSPDQGSVGEAVVQALNELAAQLPRLPWDDYFMRICNQVALRSDCLKRHVAAIIVKEKRIVSTGYNGTPRGVPNCGEGGCPRCASFGPSGAGLGDCLCSHGEENAIIQAAYHGIGVKGATIYTTTSPCVLCTKMIINAGIKEVVYNAAYPMGEGPLALLRTAGVSVRRAATGE